MSTEILKVDEVARKVRLSSKKIYELTRAGRIPYFQYPGSRLYFYRSTDIDNWIERLGREGEA